MTTARQLGAAIGAALAGFVLLETVPHAVLQAAEDGRVAAAGAARRGRLAFGLLGLLVLVSLPAVRGVRLTPRRPPVAATEEHATL